MTSDLMHKPKTRHQRRVKPRPDFEHWPKGWECRVRAAVDAEGEAIHALVDESTKKYGYMLPACRWDRIEPFWYVAEVGGYLLGAIQVCVGRPISRVELLAVRPGLSQSKKAKIVKLLLMRVVQALSLDGTTLISMIIPEKDMGFQTILERLGARHAVKGRMMLYQLQGGNHGL